VKETDNQRLIAMTNESAASASKALTMLSGEEITVQVSKTEITRVKKSFTGIDAQAIVAGIYLPITGEAKGAALLIFPEDIAYTICDLLMRREPGTPRKLTELDISALKEVGNILCGSFLTVFSNNLKIKMVENVPQFSFDMFGTLMDVTIGGFTLEAKDALVMEIRFLFEYTKVKGYIILIFGLQDMHAIMRAVELREGANTR
jgi:chemotaxis protein CheC